MMTLTPDEARVLGVLIEKAATTPEAYPLTLNSIVNGASQKNNRHPVAQFDETQVLQALNSLKTKGLVVQTAAPGSRTSKFRHEAGQKLDLGKSALALIAELLLRGPQTLGELRGRASRMQAFDSIDQVRGTLDNLAERDPPLVRQLPPRPGSRAQEYAQLLAPEEDPLEEDSTAPSPQAADGSTAGAPSIQQRLDALEREVARLHLGLRHLAAAVGEDDPTPPPADPPLKSHQTTPDESLS